MCALLGQGGGEPPELAAPQEPDAAAAQTPTPRPVVPGHRLKLANATARQASLVVLGLIVGRQEAWGAIDVAPLPQAGK